MINNKIYWAGFDFDKNNVLWSMSFGLAGVALGSGVAILVIIAFLWAIISVLLKRFPFTHTKYSHFFSTVSALYAITVITISLFYNPASYPDLVGFLLFFTPVFLLPRLHLSNGEKLFSWLMIGSCIGCLIMVPVALYQVFFMDIRAEGLTGNAGVFAVVSLLFGSIGALKMTMNDNKQRLFGFLSLIAMLVCVSLSEMRGTWLVTPIVLILIFAPSAAKVPRQILVRAIAVAIVVFSVLAVSFADRFQSRIMAFSQDLHQIEKSQNYNSSTGLRLLMLDGGLQAIAERPLTGYGHSQRMEALANQLNPEHAKLVSGFIHPHNGFLAAMLDAGIVALLALVALLFAPLVCVLRSDRKSDIWSVKVAATAITLVTYIGSGMTNILFQHDIMDTVFIGVSCVLVAACRMEENNHIDSA